MICMIALFASCSGAQVSNEKPSEPDETPAESTPNGESEPANAETPSDEPTPEEEEVKGRRAPNFTVELMSGETFKLSEHKDEVVLLNFWATWCPPCVGELPDIERLYEEHIDGLVILAVNYAEQKGTVKSFVRANGYNFDVGYDVKGEISAKYPTDGIPYTLIIYKGKIVDSFLGAPGDPYSEYKNAVMKYLK